VPEHSPVNQDAKRAAELSQAIDVRTISRSLAQIAEAPATPIERIQALLRYVLTLVDGYGVFLHEVGEQAESRVQIWRAEDNGFRDSVLNDIREPLETVQASGAAQLDPIPSMPGYFAMTAPWWHNQKLRGIVTLVAAAPSRDALKPYFIVLQSALGYMHYGLFRDEALDGFQSIEQSAAYAEMVSLMCAAPYHEESVRLMARELRKYLACAAVAVGRVHNGRSKRLRLDAISESVDFNRRGSQAGFFLSAMREATASGEMCQWPRDQALPGAEGALPAHEELHRTYDLASARSILMRDGEGRVVGVLTFLWKQAPVRIDQTNRFLDAMSPHLGVLYGGLRRMDPLRLRKFGYLCWQRFSPFKKWAIGGALALLLLLLVWPTAYPVRVDATVEPILRRVVSAQFDGILRESLVEPGQSVEAGEVLAVMDDKQLLWRESELLASRDRALRQRDLAMTDANSAVASAQMAQLEASGFDTELALLEFQRENLTLRAPIAGIVLAGDLERVEGVPVAQGDVLFEIGPMDEVVLEMRIPAADINLVEPGADLELRLASFPEQSWSGRLERIDPQSVAEAGGNYFTAEGSLSAADFTPGVLRAGMKGRATLSGETVPRVWTFTRRLWNYLHLKFFW